ncbi:MAG: hypothetical protein ABI333_01490 [bacterium]
MRDFRARRWAALAVCLCCGAACRKEPSKDRPSDVPKAAPPGMRLGPTGRPTPSAPRPMGKQQAPARPAPQGGGVDAVIEKGGLVGLWGLERVRMSGMDVPLPKYFKIRLRFQSGGKLLVHGVKRTKPTRTEGTWKISGSRLFSEVAGKKEVRSFKLEGDTLILTRHGAGQLVWRLKRMGGQR